MAENSPQSPTFRFGVQMVARTAIAKAFPVRRLIWMARIPDGGAVMLLQAGSPAVYLRSSTSPTDLKTGCSGSVRFICESQREPEASFVFEWMIHMMV